MVYFTGFRNKQHAILKISNKLWLLLPLCGIYFCFFLPLHVNIAMRTKYKRILYVLIDRHFSFEGEIRIQFFYLKEKFQVDAICQDKFVLGNKIELLLRQAIDLCAVWNLWTAKQTFNILIRWFTFRYFCIRLHIKFEYLYFNILELFHFSRFTSAFCILFTVEPWL